jgi:hypothetical protein
MGVNAVQAARRRRRMFTYLWTFLLAVGTISLIYWELTALLYILATLGVTVLLLIVALADLAHADQRSDQIADPAAPLRSGGR